MCAVALCVFCIEGNTHLLEAGGWVLELVDHGPLHCGRAYVGTVGQRLQVSIASTDVLLVAWFIEERLRHQDQ